MDLRSCLIEVDSYSYTFKAGNYQFKVKKTDDQRWETIPEWSDVQWHLNVNSEALFDAIEDAMHDADEFIKEMGKQ